MHGAATTDQIAVISYLRSLGASIDSVSFLGTPLEIMLRNKSPIELIEKMLAMGAKIRIAVGDQRTLQRTTGWILPQHRALLQRYLAQDQEFLEKINDKCPICLEGMINAELDVASVDFNQLVETECCTKYMHRSCLLQACEIQGKCPLCRAE